MLIRPAVKMFHRSLYTRYNEPDTHKSMTLYIIALGGLHLFYVKREGTLSRVG